MKKLKWNGPAHMVEADEARNSSISVAPGDVVEVSDEAFERLSQLEGWEAIEPEGENAPKKSRTRKADE